jgi:polyisoprenyl-phosphate glycosyltransferase
MATQELLVSVIAPLTNDGDVVGPFIDETVAILEAHYSNYEVVLVDDGSTDNTVDVVEAKLKQHKCLRLIRLSRSFGQEIAISAGLDTVIGDFTVIMLPESDPPALIPEVVARCRKGSGVVYGVRRDRSHEPFWHRMGAALFYHYVNSTLKLRLPENSTQFRCLSRQAVNAITQIKDRMRYLRLQSAYVGYDTDSFPYEPKHRRGKPDTRGLGEAFGLATGIVVANSTHPLRFVTFLGFAVSILNLMYAGYVLLVFLLKEKTAEGWTTQSLQISAMFFFLFLIVTVLAEYVGRILNETKERPLYYVLEERNSSVLIADETRKNVVRDSALEP